MYRLAHVLWCIPEGEAGLTDGLEAVPSSPQPATCVQRARCSPLKKFRDSGRTEDYLVPAGRMKKWRSEGTWPARWSQVVGNSILVGR